MMKAALILGLFLSIAGFVCAEVKTEFVDDAPKGLIHVRKTETEEDGGMVVDSYLRVSRVHSVGVTSEGKGEVKPVVWVRMDEYYHNMAFKTREEAEKVLKRILEIVGQS